MGGGGGGKQLLVDLLGEKLSTSLKIEKNRGTKESPANRAG